MPTTSPAPRTDWCKFKAGSLVNEVPKGVEALIAALPRGEIKVLGEIIAIRRGYGFHEVTLLDPETGATAIGARLPVDAVIPEVGRVAGIIGEVAVECDDTDVNVFLNGRAFDGMDRPGKLFSARLKLFEELSQRTGGARITEAPKDPIRRIGLVTGRGRAEADLHATLNPSHLIAKRVPRIDVKPFQVRLRDPGDIAAGISRAAADPAVQLIVVARGGGAPVDLHQFNTPEVLNAMADAVTKKFVLTAIGHAEDRTLADLLASHSEPAPVAAGAWVRKAESNRYYREQDANRGAEKAAADAESIWSFDDVELEDIEVEVPRAAPSEKRPRPWRNRTPRHMGPSPARRWAGRLILLVLGGYAGWAASGVLRGDGRSPAAPPAPSVSESQHGRAESLQSREPQPLNAAPRRAARKARAEKDAPPNGRASQRPE